MIEINTTEGSYKLYPNLDSYEFIYGNVPEKTDDILLYLRNTLQINYEELNKHINETKKWKELELVIYVVPHGSPRPRRGGNHFYVKDAKRMRDIFSKFCLENDLIDTMCIYHLKAYLPTPITSMTDTEVYLAELGQIRPENVPDFDNLAKTYTDPLQSTIILNDNLIIDGRVEKYFSIKPRCNIKIKYLESGREFV